MTLPSALPNVLPFGEVTQPHFMSGSGSFPHGKHCLFLWDFSKTWGIVSTFPSTTQCWYLCSHWLERLSNSSQIKEPAISHLVCVMKPHPIIKENNIMKGHNSFSVAQWFCVTSDNALANAWQWYSVTMNSSVVVCISYSSITTQRMRTSFWLPFSEGKSSLQPGSPAARERNGTQSRKLSAQILEHKKETGRAKWKSWEALQSQKQA